VIGPGRRSPGVSVETPYVERAIALGRDRGQLLERCRHLLEPVRPLPLFDVAGWARRWEDLLHSLV